MPTANVRYDQAEALRDGHVDVDEMRSALDAAVACLDQFGADASVELLDLERGLAGGWVIDFEEERPSGDAIEACRSATFGDLELAFLVGDDELGVDSAARLERLRACLETRGYVVESVESLTSRLGGVGPDDLAACDEESRSAR